MLKLTKLATLSYFSLVVVACFTASAQSGNSKTELDGKWTAVWMKKGNREAPSSFFIPQSCRGNPEEKIVYALRTQLP